MSKQVVGYVEDCNSCPFAFKSWRWYCTHPNNGNEPRRLKLNDTQVSTGLCPEWCPLDDTIVLVRKKPA